MEIHTMVTKRVFNITLTEDEMAVLLDMGNWNGECIGKHFFSEYSREYGTKEKCIELFKKVWEKMNKAYLGEDYED